MQYHCSYGVCITIVLQKNIKECSETRRSILYNLEVSHVTSRLKLAFTIFVVKYVLNKSF